MTRTVFNFLRLAHLQYGWQLHTSEQSEQAAIAQVQRSIEVDPAYLISRFTLGVLRLYADQVEKAQVDYQTAISLAKQADTNAAKKAYDDALKDLAALKQDRPESGSRSRCHHCPDPAARGP